jgi:hypothetical protein
MNEAPKNNPPVDFHALRVQTAQIGQSDEMKWLIQITESLQKEIETIKKESGEKDKEQGDQVRRLQTAMGDIHAENAHLREKNESKPSLLDEYYHDMFEKSSNTCLNLDLNAIPPSELATEGALVVLKTMYASPVEFTGSTKVVDLYNDRPSSRFSEEVPTLQSIGLDLLHPEHAFFVKCYMQYPTDPSYCQDGILSNASSIVTISPGEAFPPRASVLKQTPRKFRKLFKAQSAILKVSDVANMSLNL